MIGIIEWTISVVVDIVFVELLGGSLSQQLVEIAVLLDVSPLDAHLGVLVQNVSSNILHLPEAGLALLNCFPFQPEVVDFCEGIPFELAQTDL